MESTPKRKRKTGSPTQQTVKKLFSEKMEISQARLDYLVVNVVIENRLPFQFIDSQSFRTLIEALASNRKRISYKTLKSRVRDKFAAMKEALKKELAAAAVVCCTADGWKSRRR